MLVKQPAPLWGSPSQSFWHHRQHRHQRAEAATRRASKAGARILLIVDPCSVGEALRIGPYVSMIRRYNPSAHITLVATLIL